MTMLTQEARDKVIQARDLLREAITMTDPKSVDKFVYDSEEDQLRFYMFTHNMGDAAKGLNSLACVCEMTDEDLRQMCVESNVTLSEAVVNARMNLVGAALGLMLDHINDKEA